MTSSPLPHPPESTRRLGDRPPPQWHTWVPLGLVVVSLLALAVLPDTVARRGARLQREISERVTPVRTELHTFGLAFAREVLAFRAWALFPSWFYTDDYRLVGQARTGDLDVDYLTRPYDSQFMPVGRFLAWVLGGADQMSWSLAASMALGLQLAAVLGAAWTVFKRFKPRPSVTAAATPTAAATTSAAAQSGMTRASA